jgi:molecular chaperone GrpE
MLLLPSLSVRLSGLTTMAKPLQREWLLNHGVKMKKNKKVKNQQEENLTDEIPVEQQQESQDKSSAEMEQLKAELASAKDQNLRLYAEFENYRRRNAKERLELMSSANQELMQAVLPVVDDFERALKNIQKNEANQAVLEGVELIYHKLVETLKQKGLKPMDHTVGQNFDVEKMEAITRIPAPQPEMHGQVIDEVERGYHLGDKVIRYAKVIVAHHES